MGVQPGVIGKGSLTDKTRESDSAGSSQVKIVIPDDHSMVSLLGSRDELLAVIEKSFDADVHVRGNEITISGAAADNAVAVRLFEELLELLKVLPFKTALGPGSEVGTMTGHGGGRFGSGRG